jgi:hypothetical protein
MRGPRARAIQISPTQQDVLRRIQRQQTADQRLVRRASLILALAAQPCIEAVARQLGLTRVTVRAWRDRWLEAMEVLQRVEQEQTPQQLRRLVEMMLDDAPRPGKPATFSRLTKARAGGRIRSYDQRQIKEFSYKNYI